MLATERTTTMPRMTVTGQRINSPVTDPINRQTTAYKNWFARRHARFIEQYQRELEAWFSMTDEQRFDLSCRMLAGGRIQQEQFRLRDRVDAAIAYGQVTEMVNEQHEIEAAH
jgi:hypothetical protein